MQMLKLYAFDTDIICSIYVFIGAESPFRFMFAYFYFNKKR